MLVAPPPILEAGCLAGMFEGGAEKSRGIAARIAESAKLLDQLAMMSKPHLVAPAALERALLQADLLGGPAVSSTLLLPDEEAPLTDAEDIRERLEKEVDLIIEAGPCRGEATTVIDLTSGTPELVREGRGSLAPFGL